MSPRAALHYGVFLCTQCVVGTSPRCSLFPPIPRQKLHDTHALWLRCAASWEETALWLQVSDDLLGLGKVTEQLPNLIQADKEIAGNRIPCSTLWKMNGGESAIRGSCSCLGFEHLYKSGRLPQPLCRRACGGLSAHKELLSAIYPCCPFNKGWEILT